MHEKLNFPDHYQWQIKERGGRGGVGRSPFIQSPRYDGL